MTQEEFTEFAERMSSEFAQAAGNLIAFIRAIEEHCGKTSPLTEMLLDFKPDGGTVEKWKITITRDSWAN